MKKRFAMLLAFTLSMSMLSGCGAGAANSGTLGEATTQGSETSQDGGSATAEAPAEAEVAAPAEGDYNIEGKTYPFRVQLDSEKPAEEEEITLYFVNDGDVPYVALSEYMPFVGSIYEDESANIPAVEYEISYPADNHITVKRTDNDAQMDINTQDDTIQFLAMDYFVAVPGSEIAMGVITLDENGRGGISNLMEDLGSYDRSGELLMSFDLSEYMIDLIQKDGECYMPLQTVNDLLVSQNYVYVVFTREEVLACAYSGELIEEMYNAPTGVMSEEFALFNYNELRFMLDCFYGLKPEHNIDNFGDFFVSTGLIFDLSGTDPVAFDKAIRRLTMKYFDDGHSALLKNSYLGGKSDLTGLDALEDLLGDVGTSQGSKTGVGMAFQSSRAEFYPELDPFSNPEAPWIYEEVGDTAILTFDSFACNKRDYYKEADLENPQDTIELVTYAHSQITRENSPIKNVVIDLSNNGGGAADAAVYLMSWLCRDATATVALKDTLTGGQSICSYMADVNMDGETGLDDALPADIERYILISGQSFSCGNLVPSALKGSMGITLLGQTSGGGSCVVRPCTTASGTIFVVSSSKQISYVRNGSLYNVDQGVDPDYRIQNRETMYDRKKLVDFIHNLK